MHKWKKSSFVTRFKSSSVSKIYFHYDIRTCLWTLKNDSLVILVAQEYHPSTHSLKKRKRNVNLPSEVSDHGEAYHFCLWKLLDCFHYAIVFLKELSYCVRALVRNWSSYLLVPPWAEVLLVVGHLRTIDCGLCVGICRFFCCLIVSFCWFVCYSWFIRLTIFMWFCSDKLYKEIRDLNFEVVGQVFLLWFSSPLIPPIKPNSSAGHYYLRNGNFWWHLFLFIILICPLYECRYCVKKQHQWSRITQKWLPQ